MDCDYIKLGDCLEIMRTLPDDSVDVVFTSPPYGDMGRKSVDYCNGNTHTKYLDFEIYDDYVNWLSARIDEMVRVAKKAVLVNIQANYNNKSEVYKLIGKYADSIQDILIYNKKTAMPTSTPNAISNYYEMVLILRPSNNTRVKVNSKFYTNVITINSRNNNKYASVHRAVMNKEFCDEIIKEFTNNGDIVLDPFSGTGTTAISCIQQGRHYIGLEINETYYNLSLARISEETSKINLW